MTTEAVSDPVLGADAIRSFLVSILQAIGAHDDIAAETADHLVGANLAGHDSHGLQRIELYVDMFEAGHLFPAARGHVMKEADSLLLWDAERGLGQWSTRQALNWCMDHAERTGVGVASVRHSHHIGRLGHYAEVAARRGFASIVTVGTVGPGWGGVPPAGGLDRVNGTNPWCFGLPAEGRAPFIADFATSQVAEGKLRVARYNGNQVAEGLVLDKEGRPSVDPEDFYSGGTILPLGGLLTGHKGYGLGMAAALFGSLAMIDDPDPTGAGTMAVAPKDKPWTGGVFLMVIDPAWFGSGDSFRQEVVRAMRAIHGTRPAPGVDQVLVPGDPEAISREKREREGFEIPSSLWAELREIAGRYHVPMPTIST